MKVALALSITGWALERTMEIKDIAFLNSNGGNANILKKIFWPKETGMIFLLKKHWKLEQKY